MRRVFKLLFFVFYGSNLFAQSNIAISGRVLDKETQKPLAYSTVSLRNSSTGTIANAEGKFTFLIPLKYMSDTLVITMLGYESLKVPIITIDTGKNQKFSLKEKIFELNEVIISARQRSGEEILKEAFNRQKENLPQSDYALDLFVRELFYFNDSCNAVVESAAQLFGKKYPRPGFDIYLDHTRQALGRRPNLPTSLANYNPFREFQGIISRRGKMMKPCKDCQYEIEEYREAGNQQAVVISLQYKSNQSYPIFRYLIGLDNYAILKFEFETKIPFGEAFVAHHGDITSSLVSLKRTIEYKVFNNQYYLKSYRQWAGHEYRKADESMIYTTLHNFLVLANSIQTEKVEELKKTKVNTNLMDYQSTLFSQSSNNDPAFWDNFNIVERTSDEAKLYNSLSKKQ